MNNEQALEESKERIKLQEEKTGFIGLEGLARTYMAINITTAKNEDMGMKDLTLQLDPKTVDNFHADYKRVQEKIPEIYHGIRQLADKMYQDITARLVGCILLSKDTIK